MRRDLFLPPLPAAFRSDFRIAILLSIFNFSHCFDFEGWHGEDLGYDYARLITNTGGTTADVLCCWRQGVD